MVSNGSQDALFKAFDVLLEPGNSSLIVENPTYSGALAGLLPMRINLVGIDVDRDGMKVDDLEFLLKNWDQLHPCKPPPRVIYTIPTGQNPSGATLTNSRREKLYSLAEEHNLIILEDDPYWDLAYQEDKIKSFISMDRSHRVVRFDSFSKICSAGLRLGFVTGPKCLVEIIQLHQQASGLHPSGISQMLLLKLLEHWGSEGFDAHVKKVREFYKERRDQILFFCEKYLRKELVEWEQPSAGMFLWLKVMGIEDTSQLILGEAVKSKILMVPGRAFSPTSKPSPYVRASFSTVPRENLEEAIIRFSVLLEEATKR
eukprot:TRINITY_DN1013_c0_g1_i2.p1 TRINITY_DN1013_c0_g1~~TRINITY_DN1013_c0_g1_i2.p1  ORF type:complete len:315 (-),score=71.95 TRINITY_DN1013_c0_g1_i2:220-1164(-)